MRRKRPAPRSDDASSVLPTSLLLRAGTKEEEEERGMPPVLREATTESQIRACWSLNHDAWGDGLALDGYVGRELAQLAAHPRDRSQAAYQKFWVLLDDEDDDNQGEGGDILSACETVARPALLSVPATGDGDGSTGRTVETGVVWSVASVFCRRSLRGRGYASMMMSSLAASISASKEEEGEGQGEGETIGSALFSDVGPDFYARFGWRTHPSTSVTIDLRRLPEVLAFDEEGRGQWVGDDDLPAVCEQDISQIRREFQTDPSGDTLFTCLPTCDIIRWHHARMRYVFTHRNVAGEPIDRLGYKVSPESFILWTMQFSHTTDASTLYVLRERHASVKDLVMLLARTIETGRAYGMAKVVLWDAKASDINDAVGLLGLSAEAVEAQTMRQGSISALLLCRRELTDDVVWRNNEKFGWC